MTDERHCRKAMAFNLSPESRSRRGGLMPRFAADLSMLFTEAPFLERFKAVAQAGFNAVEFMFPYEFSKGGVADGLEGQRS